MTRKFNVRIYSEFPPPLCPWREGKRLVICLQIQLLQYRRFQNQNPQIYGIPKTKQKPAVSSSSILTGQNKKHHQPHSPITDERNHSPSPPSSSNHPYLSSVGSPAAQTLQRRSNTLARRLSPQLHRKQVHAPSGTHRHARRHQHQQRSVGLQPQLLPAPAR